MRSVQRLYKGNQLELLSQIGANKSVKSGAGGEKSRREVRSESPPVEVGDQQ
jgi:hypothetical protein